VGGVPGVAPSSLAILFNRVDDLIELCTKSEKRNRGDQVMREGENLSVLFKDRYFQKTLLVLLIHVVKV
jgi:hypothetical protein